MMVFWARKAPAPNKMKALKMSGTRKARTIFSPEAENLDVDAG
jgi:hypothetical protein